MINEDEARTLRRAIMSIWQQIGADVEDIELDAKRYGLRDPDEDDDSINEGRIEMCIDADRLKEEDKDAYAIWRKIVEQEKGYGAALAKVSKMVGLL